LYVDIVCTAGYSAHVHVGVVSLRHRCSSVLCTYNACVLICCVCAEGSSRHSAAAAVVGGSSRRHPSGSRREEANQERRKVEANQERRKDERDRKPRFVCTLCFGCVCFVCAVVGSKSGPPFLLDKMNLHASLPTTAQPQQSRPSYLTGHALKAYLRTPDTQVVTRNRVSWISGMDHFCPANRPTHQVLWGQIFTPPFC